MRKPRRFSSRRLLDLGSTVVSRNADCVLAGRIAVNTILKRYSSAMTHLRTLLDAAGLQRGFVTLANARELGVPPVELPKLAARGALEHCAYGLYRIAGLPGTAGRRVCRVCSLGRGRAYFSRVGDGGLRTRDVNPRRINLTVPKRVRRSGGTAYRLWIAQLAQRDVDQHLGIPVTTPLRSVMDAAAAGSDPRLIEQAIDNIERRRLASVGDVKDFKKSFADRAVA